MDTIQQNAILAQSTSVVESTAAQIWHDVRLATEDLFHEEQEVVVSNHGRVESWRETAVDHCTTIPELNSELETQQSSEVQDNPNSKSTDELPVVSMEEYWALQNQSSNNCKPGIVNINTSPTGSGKTYAAARHFVASGGGLFASKTHEAKKEAVETIQKFLKEMGEEMLVAAIPKATEDNCMEFKRADHAVKNGIPRSVVCESCPLKDTCVYRAEVAYALEADIIVMTHDRLAFTGIGEHKAVVLDEDARQVFARKSEFNEKQLREAVSALAGNKKLAGLFNSASKIHEDFVSAEVGVTEVKLMKMIGGKYQGKDIYAEIHDREVNSPFLGILLRQDKIKSIHVLNTSDEKTNYKRKQLVVLYHSPVIPSDCIVVNLDATADVDLVSRWVGHEVNNITPHATVLPVRNPTHINKKINQRTDVGNVAANITGAISLYGGIASRIGVITLNAHKDFKQHLPESFRSRIHRTSYFRSGLDMASNVWIEGCDLLVIVGDPWPNPIEAQSEMLRAGFSVDEMGSWVEIDAVDAEGTKWKTKGYSGARGMQVLRSILHVRLSQTAGRGRQHLESGIPVIIIGSVEMDIPVNVIHDSPAAKLTHRHIESYDRAEELERKSTGPERKKISNKDMTPDLGRSAQGDRSKALVAAGLLDPASGNQQGFYIPENVRFFL